MTIGTTVMDLNKVARDIDALMGQLKTEGVKLRSIGEGQVYAALQEAERLWQTSGLGEVGRTTAVARKADDYAQGMHQVDRRAANDLMQT